MPDAPHTEPLALASNGSDGRARALALAADQIHEPAALFGYHSSGRVLIIAAADAPRNIALESARSLSDAGLQCLLLSANTPATAPPGITVIQAIAATLNGYLGDFSLSLRGANDESTPLHELAGPDWRHIDLVLDLGSDALINAALPPPGYYFPGGDCGVLATALEEIPTLVGDFDKPRFFELDSECCAHARSGIVACQRCLDACPTEAISSAGDSISVDPGLCQGAGVCASVCPAGAINYSYPRRRDSLNSVRDLLNRYHDGGGQQALLLLHDSDHGCPLLQLIAAELPEQVLPFELTEIGSAGLDLWLNAIAYGARVAILLPQTTPASVINALQEQLGHAHALLTGMGYDPTLITSLPDNEALIAGLKNLPPLAMQPARHAALADKREALFIAIDHLHQQAPSRAAATSLDSGAPFGEISVHPERCTLCMACVSQCPAKALLAGGDVPALRFIEQNCIQCGLCSRSCPEDAITLSPRLLFDPLARRRERTLKEEAPFDCVVCGKPFASRSMISNIKARLAQHPMFAGAAARRLEMCEDCRVIDQYNEEQANTPELQS